VKTTGDGNGGVMVIAPHDITGVVLCGGEGRRMGGVEKPLLPLHGRPLAAHVLERLRPQVGPVIVSANRELETYRAFGHPVVVDDIPGRGPLGGLASIVPHITTPWLFCCPGDAPRLDTGVVSRLAAAFEDECVAAYPDDGERKQYLFLLVRTTALRSLPPYLAKGARSVQGWLASIAAGAVEMPDLRSTFVNVNDPHALEALQPDTLGCASSAED
jgi:molybdenum cofactor guanylyltransferase